jgi:esterase/lipase
MVPTPTHQPSSGCYATGNASRWAPIEKKKTAMSRVVLIPGDGYTLKGRVYGNVHAGHPKPAILFLNGWNPGLQSWALNDIHAHYCASKLDILCITIALRGMGSAGNIKTLTRADFLNDVITGYDYLREMEGVDQSRISVAGESFGAYMACILSTKRAVRSIALRVPTDFPNEGFDNTPQVEFAGIFSQEWKMQDHHFSESRALQGLHDFQGNILLVASERDEFVPYQTTKNYLNAITEAATLKYYLMRGVGHVLLNPIQLYKFTRMQTEWLFPNI